ncbi:hypothetical protein J6590_062127 [Homalodisca vitripennis]|nr:hypothetical protein J6590_062127 [Homalodisca vitripennis]
MVRHTDIYARLTTLDNDGEFLQEDLIGLFYAVLKTAETVRLVGLMVCFRDALKALEAEMHGSRSPH